MIGRSMEEHSPGPIAVAESLCSCLLNSEIVPQACDSLTRTFKGVISFRLAALVQPHGNEQPLVVEFGEYLTPGPPQLGLYSVDGSLAGRCITSGRPVLATDGNGASLEDIGLPSCVAVPFDFEIRDGDEAGPPDGGAACRRPHRGALVLGADSTEAAWNGGLRRRLGALVGALGVSPLLADGLAVLARHVALLLEPPHPRELEPDAGSEDDDSGTEEEDDDDGGGGSSCHPLYEGDGRDRGGGSDSSARVSVDGPGSCVLGPEPIADAGDRHAAALRSELSPRSSAAGAVARVPLGGDAEAAGAGPPSTMGAGSPSEAEKPPKAEDGLAAGDGPPLPAPAAAVGWDADARSPSSAVAAAAAALALERWRETSLGRLDLAGLAAIAVVVALDTYGATAPRKGVAFVAAALALWWAGSRAGLPARGGSREGRLVALHVALTLWLAWRGGGAGLSTDDRAPLGVPLFAWLVDAALLRQTRYAALVRVQVLIATIAVLCLTVTTSPRPEGGWGTPSGLVRAASLAATLVGAPLFLGAAIDAAVARAYAAGTSL